VAHRFAQCSLFDFRVTAACILHGGKKDQPYPRSATRGVLQCSRFDTLRSGKSVHYEIDRTYDGKEYAAKGQGIPTQGTRGLFNSHPRRR